MITVTDLVFTINEGNSKRVVLDVSKEVFDDTKINVLSGSSGSGKTTLLYALGGILAIDSGEVNIDGISLYNLKRDERDKYRLANISMIYQNHNLLSFLSVEENILLPYYIKGKKVTQAVKDQVKEYLSLLDLENLQYKGIDSLSGGEQQRVTIIRSMISDPKVILCDEPTASLDSNNTIKFMESIKLLKTKRQLTIIIATHDEKVMQYADRNIHMVDGKLL